MPKAKKTEAGRWHIQLDIAGQRPSGTFATKREADAWAAAKSTELRNAKGGVSTKTLADAMHDYGEKVSSTKRGWAKELIRLRAFEKQPMFPAKKRLDALTAGDLAMWRDARLKVNARGSVLRDLTLISNVLEIARREWGWVATNVCKDVGRPANPDHRERLISGLEVRGMIRQLGYGKSHVRTVSQSIAVCFLLALSTGMRAGELCALTWADVREDYVTLRTSKTGKGRDVPLSGVGRRLIARLKGFDDVLVFGLKSQTLDALFRRARDRAGLAGFTFHDSRHSAATRLAQRLHVLDLCRVFGWSNTSRALTYYNPHASELAKRV